MSEKKNESIRVILARMEEKQDNMATQLKTHLRHHWAASIVLLGSVVSFIFTVVVIAIRSVFP